MSYLSIIRGVVQIPAVFALLLCLWVCYRMNGCCCVCLSVQAVLLDWELSPACLSVCVCLSVCTGGVARELAPACLSVCLFVYLSVCLFVCTGGVARELAPVGCHCSAQWHLWSVVRCCVDLWRVLWVSQVLLARIYVLFIQLYAKDTRSRNRRQKTGIGFWRRFFMPVAKFLAPETNTDE